MSEADVLDIRTEQVAVQDRRRAGRREVAGALMPLLRNPVGGGLLADDRSPSEPSAPAKSVVLALAICAPVWCAIGALLYAILG